jgi:hypothetical protein
MQDLFQTPPPPQQCSAYSVPADECVIYLSS